MTFGRMFRGWSLFNKFVSILVIQAFLLSNIAFATPQENPTKLINQEEIIQNPEKIVISREHGIVKSKYIGKNGKLLIHIQDAHCNYEAQSNIVHILENLIRNYNLGLVSVEGADGIVDTSWFKAFPDEEVRKEVAAYFMKKGEITGPEFLSITQDLPFKLFGAETRSYYIENLNAFTSSYPLKEDTEKYYNQIKTVLNRLKNYIYSEDLKTLDSKIQDYESKKLPFNEYVRLLEGLAEKHRINLREYSDFFKLISALIYEKKIDFNVTDKERSTLIDELSKKMSKEGLTELVTKSLSFKTGKITSAEYYDYLKNLALKNGIELSKKYPNLSNYIIYNSVYSKIDNEKLFNDIKNLELAIKERLFKNDDQRTLDKLSRHAEILLGLVNIKLLNGDFEYYKTHKEEFSHETFSDFIKKKTVQYGLAYEVEQPSGAVQESIPKLEDFYSIAIKRDKALVDNTLNAMKKDKLQTAVLITGGFHSEGIMKLLERQGISYLVVSPNITKDVPSPYIQILTNQRTPFEEILTGSAEAKQGMLGPISIGWAVSLNRDQLNDLCKAIKGTDLSGRVMSVKEGWLKRHFALWLNKTIKYAKERNLQLPSDVEGMKNAYKDALTSGISKVRVKRAALSEDEQENFVEEIISSQKFKDVFDKAYRKKLPDTSVREKTVGGTLPDELIDEVIKDAFEDTQTKRALVIFKDGKVPKDVINNPGYAKYAVLVELLKESIEKLDDNVFEDILNDELVKAPELADVFTKDKLLEVLRPGSGFRIVLIQPKEEVPGLIVPGIRMTKKGSNFGHYSMPKRHNSEYIPWRLIDILLSEKYKDSQKKIAADMAHELAEYLILKQAFPGKEVPEDVKPKDIGRAAHFIAQLLEVAIAGPSAKDKESTPGLRSALDDTLDEITENYFTAVRYFESTGRKVIEKRVTPPREISLSQAYSSPAAFQSYVADRIKDLVRAVPELEDMMAEYAGLRDDQGDKKKELASRINQLIKEKYNAPLVEKTLGFSLDNLNEENIVTKLLTLKEFISSQDYHKYLQLARQLVFSSGDAAIDLFGGAAARLLGEGQDVDPSLSYFAHDVYDIASKRGIPRIAGTIEGISMGTRLAIQEWIDLEQGLKRHLGLETPDEQIIYERKRILSEKGRIVIINTENCRSIIKEIIDNDFYGYSPDLTVFVLQTSFPGYGLKNNKPVLIKDTRPTPAGHGDATMQIIQEGRAFWINERGKVNPIEENAVDYLMKKTNGRIKIFTQSRVNDMIKLGYAEGEYPKLSIGEVDMGILALALYQMHNLENLTEGKNTIFEMVAQHKEPKKQIPGASPIRVGEREFAVEALAQSPLVNNLVGKKGAPLNRFYIRYKPKALTASLKVQGLPVYLRFRDGYLYPETVTSDLTMLKDMNAGWAFEDTRQITDYKDGEKTLEIGLNAAIKQDRNPIFMHYVAEVKNTRKDIYITGLESVVASAKAPDTLEAETGAAIRLKGGEFNREQHRDRGGVNDAIKDRILAGKAYAILKVGSKPLWSKDKGIPLRDPAQEKLNDVRRKNLADLKDRIRARIFNFIIIEGLKEALPDDIADLVFHPGMRREAIYLDEGDFLYLLSLPDGVDLIIKALDHEKYHINNPGMSEEDVEEFAPTQNVRRALLNNPANIKATVFSNLIQDFIDLVGNRELTADLKKIQSNLPKMSLEEARNAIREIEQKYGGILSEGSYPKEIIKMILTPLPAEFSPEEFEWVPYRVGEEVRRKNNHSIIYKKDNETDIWAPYSGLPANIKVPSFDKLKELSEEIGLENIIKTMATQTGQWATDQFKDGDKTMLGWMNLYPWMEKYMPQIRKFADEVRDGKTTDIVFVGQGGSIECIKTIYGIFGKDEYSPKIHIVDTVDPEFVTSLIDTLPLGTTRFVIISKSMTTMEVHSFYKLFYDEYIKKNIPNPQNRFTLITDEGKAYFEKGALNVIDKVREKFRSEVLQRGFYNVFYIEPGSGGRYSWDTAVGILPAFIMLGQNAEVLREGTRAVEEIAKNPNLEENPPAQYGLFKYMMNLEGRNRPTLLLPEELKSFGPWAGQLDTESLGKAPDKSILTIDHETPSRDLNEYTDKRFFVRVRLGENDRRSDARVAALERAGFPVITITLPNSQQGKVDIRDFGALLKLSEFATPITAYPMGVNPVNQPGVEEYKKAQEVYIKTPYVPNPNYVIEEGNIRLDYKASIEGVGKITEQELNKVLEKLGRNDIAARYAALLYLAAKEKGRDYAVMMAFKKLALNPLLGVALEEWRYGIRRWLSIDTLSEEAPGILHAKQQGFQQGENTGFFTVVRFKEYNGERIVIPGSEEKYGEEKTFQDLIKAQAIGTLEALSNATATTPAGEKVPANRLGAMIELENETPATMAEFAGFIEEALGILGRLVKPEVSEEVIKEEEKERAARSPYTRVKGKKIEMSPEEYEEYIYEKYVKADREGLHKTLFTLANPSSEVKEDIYVILAYHTGLDPEDKTQAAVQKCMKDMKRYLGDSLIDIRRKDGNQLLKAVEGKAAQLKNEGKKFAVITIGKDADLTGIEEGLLNVINNTNAQMEEKQKKDGGKRPYSALLKVDNKGRDASILGLFDLGLRLGFDLGEESILGCLKRIAVNALTGAGFDDIKAIIQDIITKGYLYLRPIVRIDPNEVDAARKAREQALRSL